jgi:hypothetical protein
MDGSDARRATKMETEHALAQDAESLVDGSAAASGMQSAERLADEAIVRSRPDWPVVDWLPIPLAVGLPIRAFRVRDLLALEVGSVVSTEWPNGDDLPLSAGAVQLAWVDMESVEQAMAVRLTRLL